MSALRKQNQKLKEQLQKYEQGAYCYMCGRFLPVEDFYVDTDPKIHNNKKGIGLNAGRVCKQCLRKISERVDRNGELHEPTKQSVIQALKYANKPFIETVWNASIQESRNLMVNNPKANAYRAYMKNIAMKNYNGMGFEDSDMFKQHIIYDDERSQKQLVQMHAGQDSYDSFVKNKADVTRLLEYDPFEQEKISDQPFLYAQLLGLLDSSEDMNEDMMRVSSCISIVRGFLQSSKIDDAITKLMTSTDNVADNSATIKSLQDSKQKITSMITNLAAESCISLRNSKVKTKGENSWTGKLKRLKDMNLRESELNGFSEETCKGMQQVADISMSAIINKLSLDESEWAAMVKQQRQMVVTAQNKAKAYEQAFRILLRQNINLRDELEKNENFDQSTLIDLDNIIETYVNNNEERQQDVDDK